MSEIPDALVETVGGLTLAAKTASVAAEIVIDEGATLLNDGVKIKKLIAADEHEGWCVERRYSTFASREIFISPDGVEYVRTKDPALAEVTVAMKTPGVPPLLLRKRSRPFPNTPKTEDVDFHD